MEEECRLYIVVVVVVSMKKVRGSVLYPRIKLWIMNKTEPKIDIGLNLVKLNNK